MELTFTAEWADRPSTSELRIGPYYAEVYDLIGNEGHRWGAYALAGTSPVQFEQIGSGDANGRDAGKEAAETAIRRHHTNSHR